MDCVLGVAQLGLSIDPNFGQAYILPYQVKDKKDKSKVVCKVAQLQVGYKGYKQLLYRAGWFINAFPVYKCDKFEQFFNNDDMEMKYHFEPNLDDRDNSFEWVYKNLRGVFVVAKDAFGNRETRFISKKDIEKLRGKSENQTEGKEPEYIWREWYEDMALGKAVKKVSKQLPIADKKVLAVLSADDKTEMGTTINYQKTFESGEIVETEIEESKTNTPSLNDLAAKKETPAETQKPEEKTTDPFVKLKIELRKLSVKPNDAEAFIKEKEMQPEDIETWIKDTAALKEAYENYVIDKEAKEILKAS